LTRAIIKLSYDQRMELAKTPAHCPNCNSTELNIKTIPNPTHPVKSFQKRLICYCGECGYWTDFFDGWTWYPPQNLTSEEVS